MNENSKQIFVSIASLVLGFVAVFVLSGFLEKNRPALPEGYEDEDLSLQGASLKGYTLGFEGLIADWYWMKSLQYIGDKVFKSEGDIDIENLKPLNPRLLYPYLNNATELDPKFISVYEYGAIVLPAIDYEQAVKLTEKGIANNPNEWRLYHYLGYIHWRLKNYERAADVYERGSQLGDAPEFMRMMAAKMKSEGGSRATARTIYRQMYAESPDERTKENAALRLYELDFYDERDAIREALRGFQTKNNRCADSWREILPLLQSVELPDGRDFQIDKSFNLFDPTGAPYILDKAACDVRLDRERTKIPVQ